MPNVYVPNMTDIDYLIIAFLLTYMMDFDQTVQQKDGSSL